MKPTHLIGLLSIVAIVFVAGFSYHWANRSQENLSEKDETIALLENKIENNIKFTALFLKARDKIADAWYYWEVGKVTYDRGFYSYDYDEFESADEYFTTAMSYYHYAGYAFRDSKPFFIRAENFAPAGDYRNLVQKYVKLSEYGAELADYKYEASEYFATASRYYSQGKWAQGDAALEICDQRISAYDNLIPTYNDLLVEINAIEELL